MATSSLLSSTVPPSPIAPSTTSAAPSSDTLTLRTTDALDLQNLTAHLPVVATSTTAPSTILTQPLAPYPSSHPILNVHITNYVKFQVTSIGEHFSKWRQIITFLLTIYQALDHITEGAAPADEGMTYGPSIFAYLVFDPRRTSVEGITNSNKIAAWRGAGVKLGIQDKDLKKET
jgi:hypothetical protein